MPEIVAARPATAQAPVAAPGPGAWLPDGAAPDEPDEPAPGSAAGDSPDAPVDSQAARWLPDSTPVAAAASPAVAAAASPAVAPADSEWLPDTVADGEGRRALSVPLATLNPDRLTKSVAAYCNELLDTSVTPEATETILSRFHASSEGEHASAEELLRLTRKTAAEYALAPKGRRGAVAASRREECRATPARLAARDANTLAPAGRADLESHLDRCLSCQAIELRCKRAERAYTTTLATTALDDEAGLPAASDGERSSAAGPSRKRRLAAVPRSLALGGTAAFIAACAVLAFALNGGGSSPQVTTAMPASATATPSARSSSTVKRRATAVRRSVARHHGRTHKPAKHSKPRSGGSGAAASAARAPTGASAGSPAPASTAAPAVATPAPAPAAGSGSSGSGGSSGSAGGSSSSSGSVSVTQQGSDLPAQSAPTQGIGSGGSAGSQH